MRPEAPPRRTAPRLVHRAEHIAFRAAGVAVRALPERFVLGLGGALGALAGGVLRIRRRDVDRNLARAFPDRHPDWRAKVALASYRHLGREAFAVVRHSGLPPGRLLERARMEGLEVLEQALEEGRGAVLVSGHLGNWELAGSAVSARGIPLDVVVTRQKNPLMNREFVRTRARLGMRVFEKREAPRAVLRSLRENRAVALVADQNAGAGGIFVDFFGTPAATARGPALFAIRSGAPLILAVCRVTAQAPRGEARYTVRFEQVPFEPTGDLDADVLALTRAHTAALERHVAAAPEQYFWHHRRWKTRPPAEEEVTDRAG